MKKLKNIGAALLYIGLYFSVQTVVVLIFEIAVMFKEAAALMMSDGNIKGLTNIIIDRVKENEVVLTIAADVVFVAVVWLIFKIRKKKFFAEIGLSKPDPRYIPDAIVIGATLNVVISALFDVIPFPQSWWDSYDAAAMSLEEVNVATVIAISVVAPIAEEVLFRGLVFTRASRGLGIYVGAVVSSVLFGLMHGAIIWGIYAALLGLIFVFVYVRTRSLFYAMLVHFSFNTVSFFFDKISVSMIVISSILLVAATADFWIASSRRAAPAAGPDDNNSDEEKQ